MNDRMFYKKISPHTVPVCTQVCNIQCTCIVIYVLQGIEVLVEYDFVCCFENQTGMDNLCLVFHVLLCLLVRGELVL